MLINVSNGTPSSISLRSFTLGWVRNIPIIVSATHIRNDVQSIKLSIMVTISGLVSGATHPSFLTFTIYSQNTHQTTPNTNTSSIQPEPTTNTFHESTRSHFVVTNGLPVSHRPQNSGKGIGVSTSRKNLMPSDIDFDLKIVISLRLIPEGSSW